MQNRFLVIWRDPDGPISFIRLIGDDTTRDKLMSWHNIFLNTPLPAAVLKEMCDFFFHPDLDGTFKFKKTKEPQVGVVFDYIVITGYL